MKQGKCLLAVVVVVFVGCGRSDLPELGTVSGTLTLDGKPLPHAIVNFTPTEGRPSRGETDDEGQYTLMYLTDARGALVGQHKVTVTLTVTDEMDDLPEGAAPTGPILPPTASNGSIMKEVKAGDNEIDIDLQSGG